MSKLVEFVAAWPLKTLLGVLPLPGSSNSTVKGKFWEGGVMAAVMSLDERLAVATPVGPKVVQGPLAASTVIPVRPAGKDAAVSTHHS
jgi:hypothetical protein